MWRAKKNEIRFSTVASFKGLDAKIVILSDIDQFSSEVSVMLMSQDGKTYLVVANTSQTQQQYIIEGVDVTLDDAVVRRYSAEGNLLTSRRLSRSDVRHTLQAGEFSIIEIG